MLDTTRLRDICKELLDIVLFSMQIAATGFVGLSFAATMLRTHDDPNTVRLVPAPTSTTAIAPEAPAPPVADDAWHLTTTTVETRAAPDVHKRLDRQGEALEERTPASGWRGP